MWVYLSLNSLAKPKTIASLDMSQGRTSWYFSNFHDDTQSKSLPHSHTKTLFCIVHGEGGVHLTIDHPFVTNKHGMKVGSTHVLIRWKWPPSCFFLATLSTKFSNLFENGLLHVFSWQLLPKFPTQNGGARGGEGRGGGCVSLQKLVLSWIS